MRAYLQQLRQELGARLIEQVYKGTDEPSKVTMLGILKFMHYFLVVALFCSTPFHGQDALEELLSALSFQLYI